jgi:biotin carboxyl carrier protein
MMKPVRVGAWQLRWLGVPKGQQGRLLVEVLQVTSDTPPSGPEQPSTQILEVAWSADAEGVVLTLPDQMVGFDLETRWDEEGRSVFDVRQRGSANEWSSLYIDQGLGSGLSNSASGSQKQTRVRAQMPGKILKIWVAEGQVVQKDQPLLVMEAMKMENEIRAPMAGTVQSVNVSLGQAVESGAELLRFARREEG